MGRAWIVAALAIAPPAAEAQDTELFLVCEGKTLTSAVTGSTNAVVTDSRGNSATGTAVDRETGFIPLTVQVRIENGMGKINLPMPPSCAICTGESGWRDIRDLKIEENRITGRIRYNFLQSSTFEIDRRTGSMVSRNGFQGQCEARDLSQRRF